ncbi:hypothetical protein D3C86_1746980 [compost metagenome]
MHAGQAERRRKGAQALCIGGDCLTGLFLVDDALGQNEAGAERLRSPFEHRVPDGVLPSDEPFRAGRAVAEQVGSSET